MQICPRLVYVCKPCSFLKDLIHSLFMMYTVILTTFLIIISTRFYNYYYYFVPEPYSKLLTKKNDDFHDIKTYSSVMEPKKTRYAQTT